jgi:hypothetical protein
MTIEERLALLEQERPNQTYNMWAAAAVPSTVLGVDAFIKNKKAKNDLKKQQGYVDTLMKNYMETPIYNPYDNLSVATQANQIKREETDKALANTLDTLRAQGASAGGATALAQAALKSKTGIAADIEKQEVMNERLKAQGEIMVQNAEMQRKGQQMDYEQSKADQLRAEQFAYGERAADMAGALGSLGLQAARGLGSGKNKTSDTVDPTVDPTVDTTESNFVENDQYSPNFIPNPDMDTLEIADPPPMYQERDAFGNVVKPVDYNFLQNPGMPSFDPSFANPNDEAHQRTLNKIEKIKLDKMSQEERAKYFTKQYIGTNFKI